MEPASSEPRKRQQGFAISPTNTSNHPSKIAANIADPSFAPYSTTSSYIDTSYLLDDEMWRTMTVDADISKALTPEAAHTRPHNDGNAPDSVMEDIIKRPATSSSRHDSNDQSARYPWDEGLHHLNDWLGLPSWSADGVSGKGNSVTTEKFGISGEAQAPYSSVDTPDSAKGVELRLLPRLDGSPFTESSFSTGESMSSSEQTISTQGAGAFPSSSPSSMLSSLPTQKTTSASVAQAATKAKRQRSVTTSSSTAVPESVSAILKTIRTGRTATSSNTSGRRAISANGRGDVACGGRENKRSISAERNVLAKEATSGGVGKAARAKTGRARRTSVGPAAQAGSCVGRTTTAESPSKTPLHIDTTTATATMSNGPQTFGGMPTMSWGSSPWSDGIFPHPPHWGHFAPGGMPYGTLPSGWPVWSPPPQSMPMHPAWSLPLNGGCMTTPTPGGADLPSPWPGAANSNPALSPGAVHPLSLPTTNSMQSIFSSMQGLHVGAAGIASDQEGIKPVQATSEIISPPFQPTGQSDLWGTVGVTLRMSANSEHGPQKSPSVTFHSKAHPDSSSSFPWNVEDPVQKAQPEKADVVSSRNSNDDVHPEGHFNDKESPHTSNLKTSTSVSPPSIRSSTGLLPGTTATTSERPTHHRKPSRSLTCTTSLRKSKLEDVPEGETVLSHSPPTASYSPDTIASVASLDHHAEGVATCPETSSDKPRNLSENKQTRPDAKATDSKKEKAARQEEEDNDCTDDEDGAEDDTAISSRRPARVRGSGPGRPVRSEQERRKRRRESHNLVERRRRDTINERIAELASLLPEAMLLDAIAHSQGGGNNSKVVQVAVPEETLSRLNSAGRSEMGGGSTLDLLSLASVPANSETLALAQARPNKGIILHKSVDYIRALQEFIEQQGKHARMLKEEVERVTSLLEESKSADRGEQMQGKGCDRGDEKRLWPAGCGQHDLPLHQSRGDEMSNGQLSNLGLFQVYQGAGERHEQHQHQDAEQSTEESPRTDYPPLGQGQSPPPTLAEWLAAAHSHQQNMGDDMKVAIGDKEKTREEAMTF